MGNQPKLLVQSHQKTGLIEQMLSVDCVHYYHKYLVQHSPKLWGDILEIYREPAGWIYSTAAARLNGYAGGYATMAQLEEEIDIRSR